MEKTSRQTQCPVSKILQRYIKELKLTVLLVLTMVNLFLLSRKAFVMWHCFRAPIKTFFFDACQSDCQIVRPALVSGPPNRKKPYNKHLLASFFRSVL